MSRKDYVRVKDVMTQNVVTASEEDTVFTAASKMSDKNISSIVVTKDNAVVGVFTEDDILLKVTEAGKDPRKVKVKDAMVKEVVTINPAAFISSAGKVLKEKNFEILPVVENDLLVGVISKADVSGALGSIGYFRKVADIMRKDIVHVDVESYVIEAANKMAETGITYVLVMNKDRVAGIFTEKDLIRKVTSQLKDPVWTKIIDVMTPSVMSVDPETTVTEANRIQKSMGIRELPVMEDGKLVGIVTENDILEAVESINLEYNALTNIATLAMHNASSSISQMLRKNISIDVPSVEYVPLESIFDMPGSRFSLVAGVLIEISGELSGSVMLLFPEKTAYLLIDLAMGKCEGTTSEITSMGQSALSEICSVLVGQYLNVLSDKIKVKTTYSVPRFAFDMVGSIMDHIVVSQMMVSDYVMVTRTSFSISSNEIGGMFLFTFTPDSLEKMAQKLLSTA
jgi:chemotaxis protein CheC